MEFDFGSRSGHRPHRGHGDAHRRQQEMHHEMHSRMHGGFEPPFGPGFGPGPGGPFGFGGGRGRRHGGDGGRRGRRGNVRAAILALLTERPMHGYEMIQELDQRTGGVWRPSPGSVYPTLQLLDDEGLIASTEEAGRKAYALTDAGQAEAAAAAANPPWGEFSEETVSTGHDTREAIGGILMALRQIGFEGDREQWQKVVAVLNETRRKLYAILAESE
jgi:DNA-binding PadR family transcriptional regulator